ncbi:hypothetical protein FRC01_010280, partial [Tulasnella sp. 417]
GSTVSAILTQVSSDINRLDAQETNKKPIPIVSSHYAFANYICGRVQRSSAKPLFKATFNTNSDNNNTENSNSNSNTDNVLSALYLQLPSRLARARPLELLGASTGTSGDLGPPSNLADVRKERMVLFSSVPVPGVSFTGASGGLGGTCTPIQSLSTNSSRPTAAPGTPVSSDHPPKSARRQELDPQDKEESEETTSSDTGGTTVRHAGGGIARAGWPVRKFSFLTVGWIAGKPPTPAQSGATQGDSARLLRRPTYDPVCSSLGETLSERTERVGGSVR